MTRKEQFEREYADYTGMPLAQVQATRLVTTDSYAEPKISAAWHWFQRGEVTTVSTIVADMMDCAEQAASA